MKHMNNWDWEKLDPEQIHRKHQPDEVSAAKGPPPSPQSSRPCWSRWRFHAGIGLEPCNRSAKSDALAITATAVTTGKITTNCTIRKHNNCKMRNVQIATNFSLLSRIGTHKHCNIAIDGWNLAATHPLISDSVSPLPAWKCASCWTPGVTCLFPPRITCVLSMANDG